MKATNIGTSQFEKVSVIMTVIIIMSFDELYLSYVFCLTRKHIWKKQRFYSRKEIGNNLEPS